ncbi:YadA C-terminal domain-containing protein [Vibrio gallicus]|uniref:YadA C-terminal domain-containing protein n=1 Tax=Vibrio gallicus TaxID=190897 RepID=UPI0021C3797F|nr:YadA C-terminal domain-containing protein [Vibrio gallicus]
MKTVTKTLLALSVASVSVNALAAQTLEQQLHDLKTYSYSTAGAEERLITQNRLANADTATLAESNRRATVGNAETSHNNNQWLGQVQQQADSNHRAAVGNAETSHNNNQWLGQVQQQADSNHRAAVGNAETSHNSNQWLGRVQKQQESQRQQLTENAGHTLENRANLERQGVQVTANTQTTHNNSQGVAENAHRALENRAMVERDEAVLAQHQHTLDTHTQALSNQQKQVATVSNQAAHAENLAERNRALVEQNSEKVAQNSADLKDLRKDFEQMAKNVDGAYAESAAFAGLVDPYGVGHFTVTTAVGYHGDAQAVAVGVGERFTEHFTAKLGGAYDTATESMSAYAGVGYEF